jgi:hypothetical protein
VVAASKYARKAGQSNSRELTGPEQAVRSMRRAVEKAEEYKRDIEELCAQVQRQATWLYSADAPDDHVWDQRKDIHDDRWQQLEQTIGNLTGWVAIHLAEAGRFDARERQACAQFVAKLYEFEQWILAEDLASCVQYPNGDPCPF